MIVLILYGCEIIGRNMQSNKNVVNDLAEKVLTDGN